LKEKKEEIKREKLKSCETDMNDQEDVERVELEMESVKQRVLELEAAAKGSKKELRQLEEL